MNNAFILLPSFIECTIHKLFIVQISRLLIAGCAALPYRIQYIKTIINNIMFFFFFFAAPILEPVSHVPTGLRSRSTAWPRRAQLVLTVTQILL